MAEGYDYVIVGGGTAGCVLAARLSETDATVLLLEAGRRDRHPLIHAPAGFARMTAGPFTWGYATVPQLHAENRVIPYAQARVLGGGGSINAAVFTRGAAFDYDRWAFEEGCDGWSFADVQKYFLRSEGNADRSGPWHRADGPLGVADIPAPQPVTEAFVRSCRELGMPLNTDFNGPTQAGAGVYQTMTRDRRRSSTARDYLRPVLGRPNLTVLTGCLALSVTLDGGRATGVSYARGGAVTSARATGEVIVAAGAIGSPKLMMLSGVGPAAHLKAAGVDVTLDLPGVGQNLNDHFGVDTVAELTGDDSLDRYDRPHRAAWAALRYALFRTGPATSNIVEGGAYWFADPSAPAPDLQFHFLAASGAEAGVPGVAGGAGVTLNSYTLRPKSRGTVKLRSADPAAAPLVDPNYLAEVDDRKTTAEGVRLSREILRQPSLQTYIRRIQLPGDDVTTEADFIAYAQRYGRTSYHPVGACRMGVDEMAVVDPRLRVRGLDGIRVCDSSIMPSLIGANTNAPTVMIAEKAADMIRADR